MDNGSRSHSFSSSSSGPQLRQQQSSSVVSSAVISSSGHSGDKSNIDNRMTWFEKFKRAYVLVVTAGAIAMSVIVALSCEFFAFRALDNVPWPNLSPPFNTLPEASVGLFSYSSEPGQKDAMVGGDSCTPYDDGFLKAGQGRFFLAAQYCAIAAPFAAAVALTLLLSEMICCRLKGTFIWVPLLLLSATILQGATFLVFADGSFCFDAASQNQCRLTSGAWFSIGSIVAYLVVAILTTSLPNYKTKMTCCLCFDITRGTLTRTKSRSITERRSQQDLETGSNGKSFGEDSDGGVVSTSDSSTEKIQNYNHTEDDFVDEDEVDDEFQELDDSVMAPRNFVGESAGMDSLLSPRSNSIHDSEPDLPPMPNSAINNEIPPYETQDEILRDMVGDDMIVGAMERPASPSSHHRRPDFLDMCCAGDPLKVEHHLDESPAPAGSTA